MILILFYKQMTCGILRKELTRKNLNGSTKKEHISLNTETKMVMGSLTRCVSINMLLDMCTFNVIFIYCSVCLLFIVYCLLFTVQEELGEWLLPTGYDYIEAEATHLIQSADDNKVGTHLVTHIRTYMVE